MLNNDHIHTEQSAHCHSTFKFKTTILAEHEHDDADDLDAALDNLFA